MNKTVVHSVQDNLIRIVARLKCTYALVLRTTTFVSRKIRLAGGQHLGGKGWSIKLFVMLSGNLNKWSELYLEKIYFYIRVPLHVLLAAQNA